MRTATEPLLLERAQRFEKEALAEIFDRYNAGIYRYAMRLLGDSDLARECMSETFSRFLSAVKRGAGPSEHLQAYLYRIAHNWITDFYRKSSNEPVELDPQLAADPSDQPSVRVSEEMERARVRSALASLTPEQRQVIVLRYYEDWDNAEIAAALNKPVGAIKALQHRAILGLRLVLGEELEIENELE